MNRDSIYSLPRQHIGAFEFDESVVDVFPNMIARSVPGYASILAMIQQLAGRFVVPGSDVYDLGCSLGAATLLIRQQAPAECTIHAVDNAPAMVRRLKEILKEHPSEGCASVQVHQADLADVSINNASFVVLNFTLQFVPAEDREPILQSIFAGTRPGGGLILSEKICFEDHDSQQLMSELHHDFKRAHGYSDLEISQKRTALENRLIPETLQKNLSRLTAVGYQTVVPWFQCFNFVSVLAVKSEAAE